MTSGKWSIRGPERQHEIDELMLTSSAKYEPERFSRDQAGAMNRSRLALVRMNE